MSLQAELDRQLAVLVELGYPELTGLGVDRFVRLLAPLRDALDDLPRPGQGEIPFAIVVTAELVSIERAMHAVTLRGRQGYVDMTPTRPDEYSPLDDLEIPPAPAYLVAAIDPGSSLRNVTPDDALARIAAAGRSPLTIDEGIALVTLFPNVLEERDAFSVLGSRRGDRRVPAIWISAGRPRLGWCWAGNPHSWLGSASCGGRVGSRG